jgi:hypothetical protein
VVGVRGQGLATANPDGRTCREHGLEIADAEPLDGFTRAYVNDPFGNRLELMEAGA